MNMRWVLFALGWLLVLAGGVLAHRVQTAGGVSVEDIRIDMGEGKQLSALLYTPPNATPQSPAPAILAVHGYINSRETQSGFAIEYARRGYVVLALDQAGHGFSDGPAFSGGFGGPAALAYLHSLPIVDKARIGMEGHSMGGWTVLAAASAMPEGYASVALVGSSTGPGFAAPGTTTWPRNLGVIFSRYDEFSQIMWGVAKGADVASSAKLKGVFGTDADIVPRKLYGSVADGTARWLATPDTTHPGDHISPEAIADAVEWMETTLGAPKPLAPDDQTWHWKEAGTLLALIGGAILALGTLDLVLSLGWFAPARVEAVGGAEGRSAIWWIALVVTSILPAILYFPVTELAGKFPANPVFPQRITNQILVWALASGVVSLIFPSFWRRGHAGGGAAQKALAAVLAFAVLYGAVALSDVVFKTDFRFWVVALKPMAPHHWPTFLACLVPFTAFFYVTQRAFFAGLAVRGDGAASTYLTSIVAGVGGFTVMMVGLYVCLFATGKLPGTDPLFSVIGMQFVPVLLFTSIASVFAWRRTGGALTGALLCGGVIAWYVVAGQATHV